MTTHAYLRVSTDAQDVANQRHGIEAYCAARALTPIYAEDTASGRVEWRQRKLGALITEAKPGDLLIVAEISRLARNTLQVLEVARECVERQIHLHVVKNGMVLDGSLQSKITATVLGLAAEIERDMISSRTKEALAKLKADGVQLGRPAGPVKKLALDKHRKTITAMIASGVALRAIARHVECSPGTLYNWLERRGVAYSKKQTPAAVPSPD